MLRYSVALLFLDLKGELPNDLIDSTLLFPLPRLRRSVSFVALSVVEPYKHLALAF